MVKRDHSSLEELVSFWKKIYSYDLLFKTKQKLSAKNICTSYTSLTFGAFSISCRFCPEPEDGASFAQCSIIRFAGLHTYVVSLLDEKGNLIHNLSIWVWVLDDFMRKSNNWLDIYDPRNPLNKRRGAGRPTARGERQRRRQRHRQRQDFVSLFNHRLQVVWVDAALWSRCTKTCGDGTE